MIYANIFAFVLALVASVCAALALIICSRLTRALASQRSTNASNWRIVSDKLAKLAKESPTELASAVAGLTEDVKRLAATHRRFAGRFDAYVHHSKQPNGDDVADDELRAMLELQKSSAGNAGG